MAMLNLFLLLKSLWKDMMTISLIVHPVVTIASITYYLRGCLHGLLPYMST